MDFRWPFFLVTAACFAVAVCGCKGAGPRSASGAGAPSAPAEKAPAAVASAPVVRPFAGSPSEATQLIDVVIEKNSSRVKKCVEDYRVRKKLPHERVEIAVGIDQEGRLLGAALKGADQDSALSECVQRVLANAPFPRSHAGIILLTKTYEEIGQ